MPLDRGLIIREDQASVATLPHVESSIVAMGTATDPKATAADGKFYPVGNSAQASTLFGSPQSGDTLPDILGILQRYGAGKIVAGKIPAGGNPDSAARSLIDQVPNIFSQFGISPDVILTCGFNSVAVLSKALEIGEKIGAVVIGDFPPTTTADGAALSGGLGGQTNRRLIQCFGTCKNSKSATPKAEPLSYHLAGIMAGMNYGRSPGNQLILGADTVEPAMSMSLTDEAADSEKLNDKGIVTFNRRSEGLVTWGDMNASYPGDRSALTLINGVRVRDRIIKMAQDRAARFIDFESSRRTGKLLETSLLDGLAIEARKNSIRTNYTAEFIEAESDYNIGKLVARLTFSPFLPVRLIELRPMLVVTITVGG